MEQVEPVDQPDLAGDSFVIPASNPYVSFLKASSVFILAIGVGLLIYFLSRAEKKKAEAAEEEWREVKAARAEASRAEASESAGEADAAAAEEEVVAAEEEEAAAAEEEEVAAAEEVAAFEEAARATKEAELAVEVAEQKAAAASEAAAAREEAELAVIKKIITWKKGDYNVALRSNNKKYCSVDAGNIVRCNKDGVDLWEKYSLGVTYPGKNDVSLKSMRTGKYCKVNKYNAISCDEDSTENLPRYWIRPLGTSGKIGLKSKKTRKWCASDSGNTIRCDQDALGEYDLQALL